MNTLVQRKQTINFLNNMKKYRYVINGEVKECYAPNLLNAMVKITRAFPEVKKTDYRTLKITEVNED